MPPPPPPSPPPQKKKNNCQIAAYFTSDCTICVRCHWGKQPEKLKNCDENAVWAMYVKIYQQDIIDLLPNNRGWHGNMHFEVNKWQRLT